MLCVLKILFDILDFMNYCTHFYGCTLIIFYHLAPQHQVGGEEFNTTVGLFCRWEGCRARNRTAGKVNFKMENG